VIATWCHYSIFPWQSPLVKAAKGPTPIPTSHPSRPSFEDDRDLIRQHLQSPPKSHAEAKRLVSVSPVSLY
jgi:hypothetical protein